MTTDHDILAWRDRNPEAAEALLKGTVCVVPLELEAECVEGPDDDDWNGAVWMSKQLVALTYDYLDEDGDSVGENEDFSLAAVRLDKPTAPPEYAYVIAHVITGEKGRDFYCSRCGKNRCELREQPTAPAATTEGDGE